MNEPPTHRHQIIIPEEDVKVDQKVADLYISFSGELLRLALIGIGVIGFVLSQKLIEPEQLMREDARLWVLGALGSLGLAASLALVHRYLASQSIAYQISTLRARRMMELQTEDGLRAKWTKDFNKEKAWWYGTLNWSGYSILFCAICLGVGIALLVIGLITVFSEAAP